MRDKIYAVTFRRAIASTEYFAPDGQDAIVLKPGAAQRIREQLYHLPLTPRAPVSNSPLQIAPTVAPVSDGHFCAGRSTLTRDAETRHNCTLFNKVIRLFSLARRYGVTVEAIQQANNLTGDNIYVGQAVDHSTRPRKRVKHVRQLAPLGADRDLLGLIVIGVALIAVVALTPAANLSGPTPIPTALNHRSE